MKQVDQFNYLSGKFGNVADKSYANMLASNVNKGIITQEEANAILKKNSRKFIQPQIRKNKEKDYEKKADYRCRLII